MRKFIDQLKKKKYFEYILLSIVLVLGFAVRLYKIQNPIADWHSWRQADTAAVTRNYVKSGINLLLPKYDDISSIQSQIFNPEGYRMVEFPFYNALGALLFKTFSVFSLEVWSRLLTIVFSIVTAFFLYLIARTLMGRLGGILAAFFYLFIPFNIYFTRVILPDPMGVMFGVISLWAFLKFVGRGSKFYFSISGIFMAMALLIKPYLGFYLIPVFYLALDKFGFTKKLWKLALAFSLIVFIPFLTWRWWEGHFPEGIPLYLWAFNGDEIRFRPSFWNWIFGERLGHLILGSLGIIPFAFGVLWRRTPKLITWFLVGALTYVILVASANVKHDYYQILTIPVIALTLSSGFLYLWNNDEFSKILSRTIAVFSVGVMLITGWYQVKGNFVVNHYEIIDAGKEVAGSVEEDALVVAPYNGDTAFLYQTQRRGWPVVDDSFDHLIEKGADYYVSVDLGSADTKFVEANFETLKKTNTYIIVNLGKKIKK